MQLFIFEIEVNCFFYLLNWKLNFNLNIKLQTFQETK